MDLSRRSFLKGAALSALSVVSGSTMTSNAIIAAVNDCLAQAK